jgi:hypothetical protein
MLRGGDSALFGYFIAGCARDDLAAVRRSKFLEAKRKSVMKSVR